MEFSQGREGYCEEEDEDEEKHMTLSEETGKYPFQSSPSSSPSPSSSSSHYKSVVPRQNGWWGSQIYDNNQQVFPGTLESEEEASRAYDHAAASICGLEAVTNFMDLSSSSGEGGRAAEGIGASGSSEPIAREHMFDKVVTPSDVGKLNRLVIPKQHAQKYFPLDSATNYKGLLLNFEDRSGKPWRFRYSYWNSSQSYVMTKGWSRFVKEKKLDAGDIVTFERGVGESGRDRLFIDWKRRPDAVIGSDPSSFMLYHLPSPMSLHRSPPSSRLFLPAALPISIPPQSRLHVQQLDSDHRISGSPYSYNVVNSGPVFHLQSRDPAQMEEVQRAGGDGDASGQMGKVQPAGVDGDTSGQMVFDSLPVVHGKPATEGKRLRLFGVNLDCPTTEAADAHALSSMTQIMRESALLDSPCPQSSAFTPLQLKFNNGSSSAPTERTGKDFLFFDLDS